MSVPSCSEHVDEGADPVKNTVAQAQPTTNKAIIGVGAILGGALLFVSEIDTVLEVAGLFAAGNFALRNLLFADDRKRTKGDLK